MDIDEHILIQESQRGKGGAGGELKGDNEENDDEAFSSFMYGLKAPATKKQWPNRLKKFFDFGINSKLTIQQQSRI
ncbi:MAG TPA: hypothetical protein VFZ46_00235, partial [Nitrososphaeraceae archaeon]